MTGLRPRPSVPPITDDEMRARWRNGDTLASINSTARTQRGLSKVEVRQIVFGGTGK